MEQSGPEMAATPAATVTSVTSGPQCAICMSALRDGVTLDPCGHSICQGCFGTWAETCRCAIPGVPPECVHCATKRVECPFCRVLTTHPSNSENDKRRRKHERDQRHALRRAREQRQQNNAAANMVWVPRNITLTKDASSSVGVRFRGRVVIEVMRGSPAEAAGLREGMRIRQVERRAVEDHSDSVHDALRSAPATFSLQVEVPQPIPVPQDDAPIRATAAVVNLPAPEAQPQQQQQQQQQQQRQQRDQQAQLAREQRERERRERDQREAARERERERERNFRLERFFADQREVVRDRAQQQKQQLQAHRIREHPAAPAAAAARRGDAGAGGMPAPRDLHHNRNHNHNAREVRDVREPFLEGLRVQLAPRADAAARQAQRAGAAAGGGSAALPRVPVPGQRGGGAGVGHGDRRVGGGVHHRSPTRDARGPLAQGSRHFAPGLQRLPVP